MALTEAQKALKKAQAIAVKEGHQKLLKMQLEINGLPLPTPEFMFHPTRKWRIDFAWPDLKLALEVEGGVYTQKGGGHRSISGWDANQEKYNELTVMGWFLLRVTPDQLQLKNGMAIGWLKRFFDNLR